VFVTIQLPHVDEKTHMTLEERSYLVLACARVLYENGQATEQTVTAAEQLGRTLGLRAKIMPRWGQLLIQSDDGTLVSQVAADPTGVNMERVASATRAIHELAAGRLAPKAAAGVIEAVSRAPPASTWLFTLAAGAGAMALSVIFGIEHIVSALFCAARSRATAQTCSFNPSVRRSSPASSARWRSATS